MTASHIGMTIRKYVQCITDSNINSGTCILYFLLVSPTIMTIQNFPFWSVSFPVILLVVVVILIIVIIVIVLWKKNKKRKKVLPISGEKGENKDATDVIASMEENIDGEEDELQITRAHSLVHIHGML